MARHWSSPVAVNLAGDQFQSWAAYRRRRQAAHRHVRPQHGRQQPQVRLLPGDRDSSEFVLAVGRLDGAVGSNHGRSVVRWDPDANFPFATSFLGDYSGIAVVPGTTHTVAYWTDMREQACFAGAAAAVRTRTSLRPLVLTAPSGQMKAPAANAAGAFRLRCLGLFPRPTRNGNASQPQRWLVVASRANSDRAISRKHPVVAPHANSAVVMPAPFGQLSRRTRIRR